MFPSILERKFFSVESKFLHIVSIVASYVKSKCRALYMYINDLVKFKPLKSRSTHITTCLILSIYEIIQFELRL